jgi:hypothetical protein
VNDAKAEIGGLGRELKAPAKAARAPVAGAQPRGGPCAHPAAIAALELQLRAARGDLKRAEAAAARAQGEAAARQDVVELANRALAAAQVTLKGMAANLTKMVPSLGPVKARAVPALPAFQNELVDTPEKVAAAAVREIARQGPRKPYEAFARRADGSLPAEGLRPAHRDVLAAGVTLDAFGMDEVPISALAALSRRAMGGGFQNLVTELCTKRAATRQRPGYARAADILFPEGA